MRHGGGLARGDRQFHLLHAVDTAIVPCSHRQLLTLSRSQWPWQSVLPRHCTSLLSPLYSWRTAALHGHVRLHPMARL